jgi:hypothetical protein
MGFIKAKAQKKKVKIRKQFYQKCKGPEKIVRITGLGPCRSSRWTGLISVMTISKSSQCLPRG